MWILFAFGSALFAGLTSILAKCGFHCGRRLYGGEERSTPCCTLFWRLYRCCF